MISGINHVAIKVRDLGAAERFYCGVLGLLLRQRWPAAAGGGDRSLWLDTGDGANTFLALEVATPVAGAQPPGQAPPDTQSGGHHLLALRITADQRALFEQRLSEAGVLVSHRTAFTIYFMDPEGNRLALSHHPVAFPGFAAPVGGAS